MQKRKKKQKLKKEKRKNNNQIIYITMATTILPTPVYPNFGLSGISTNPSEVTIDAPKTSITSDILDINDSIVVINNNDAGPGVTKTSGLSGLEIFRGGLTNYQIVFDEATDLCNAGFKGFLKPIPTIGTVTINDILGWNGSVLTGVPNNTYLKNINQSLNTTATPTLSSLTLSSRTLIAGVNPIVFPSTAGFAGNTLITDGAGNLSWTTISGGNDNIHSVTTTTSTNYTILLSDEIINWTGTADGQMTLPSVASFGPTNGRSLIIQCRSIFEVTIYPALGDVIGGTSSPILLSDMYDRVCLVSDGIDNWIIT